MTAKNWPARLDRWGSLYARLALGAAFLSAVASRFGLWQGKPSLEHFAGFIQRTAEVNSFMPAATIPFLAWAATVSEILLAILLAMFGTAMTISLGIKEPLDASVFSASAAAALLALRAFRQQHQQSFAIEKKESAA